jgi:hypothetical protein
MPRDEFGKNKKYKNFVEKKEEELDPEELAKAFDKV